MYAAIEMLKANTNLKKEEINQGLEILNKTNPENVPKIEYEPFYNALIKVFEQRRENKKDSLIQSNFRQNVSEHPLTAENLENKMKELNNLIQKTKKSIEKYKEYKKLLIFEAVTGKIDLRDYELEGGEELAEHNNSSQTERECISAVD
jgi:hypothetical protein